MGFGERNLFFHTIVVSNYYIAIYSSVICMIQNHESFRDPYTYTFQISDLLNIKEKISDAKFFNKVNQFRIKYFTEYECDVSQQPTGFNVREGRWQQHDSVEYSSAKCVILNG